MQGRAYLMEVKSLVMCMEGDTEGDVLGEGDGRGGLGSTRGLGGEGEGASRDCSDATRVVPWSLALVTGGLSGGGVVGLLVLMLVLVLVLVLAAGGTGDTELGGPRLLPFRLLPSLMHSCTEPHRPCCTLLPDPRVP